MRRLYLFLVLGLAFAGLTCAPQGEVPKNDDKNNENILYVPAALKDRIDFTLKEVHGRDLLISHGFWTVFHGILGMGFDTMVQDSKTGKKVNAIDYIFQGQEMPGLRFTPAGKDFQDLEVETSRDPSTMFVSQGHQDQFVAEMIQWGMPLDRKVIVNGKEFTFRSFCRYSKNYASLKAKPKQELSWAIIIVAQFFGTDHKWTNLHGETLTLEEAVRYELNEPIAEGAACGGTHRLFGLTWAYHLHRQKGGKKEGVWKDVADTITKFKKKAKELQNKDGFFSTAYFAKSESKKDRKIRIETTGHILEWLALAMTDKELREQWVQDAVGALCVDILEGQNEFLPGGALYHATHGLHIYRDRIHGTPNRPGGPVIILPPKD